VRNIVRSRRFALALAAVSLLLGTVGVGIAHASDDPLEKQTISVSSDASPDFSRTSADEGCHGHVDIPVPDGGSTTYPANVYGHGYIECTQPEDLAMKIQLQYYTGMNWKTIATPYGYNHHLTSFLGAGVDKPCHGGAFKHYRTIGKGTVDGVAQPGIASHEMTANCGV
jgi:hypothetical protein